MKPERKIIKVVKEKIVDESMDECWKELTDFSKETAYWPNIRKIKVTSEKDNTFEREAVVGLQAFGAKTRQTLTLDEPNSFHVEFHGDGIKGFRDIRMVEFESRKAQIIVSWELHIGNVPEFVLNIIQSQITKATDNALEKLNQFLLKKCKGRGL